MKSKSYRRRKFNKKRKSTYKIFFLVIIGMSLGFAAINTTLQLIGTLNISRTTWNIHWENPTKTGGVAATKDVALKENDNTTVEYQVKLSNPGDYYEFTVDAKNDGTIDGMITSISNKVYENNTEVALPGYLESTITYADGTTIGSNHLLACGKKERYKVKVLYKTGLAADQLPDTEKTYNFRFTVTYMQADENARTPRANFSNSSWQEIVTAYNNGQIENLQQDMENGIKREVKMDLNNDGTDETYHLRIANISTPEECSQEGFSQTACGLVVEFTDILTLHRMNPYTNGYSNGDGNYGGWEYSEMRTYVNSTIYNSLPTELKDSIIDTYVISSHGANESSNFETIDKLYLLSPKEIKNSLNYDSAKNQTRVLDYYETADLAREYKYYDQVEDGHYYWYTRTASSNNGSSFFYVIKPIDIQMWDDGPSSYEVGVAPAFRIG